MKFFQNQLVEKKMNVTMMASHQDKQLLCILENAVIDAYKRIDALDWQAHDEEVASALITLGRCLLAYREFSGVSFSFENHHDDE
jgi:hypothetical protein